MQVSPDRNGVVSTEIARIGATRLSSLLTAVAALGLLVPLAAQPVPPAEGGPALELVNLDLLDSRDGYAIPPDSRFLPGERIHVYCQIKGYSVGQEDRVRLRYEVAALDPSGRRFYSPDSGRIDTELAPQDENWMPVVRYSPRIPDHAGGGTYTVRVAVHDELSGTSISADVPVTVEADRVERSDELLVRNFRFARAENGDALPAPEFRPGEEIWAAFYITGYETRDNNTYSVESDAWVLDAEGEKLFAFEASGEQGRPYYPRLWLPAKLRLDLEETVPPGRYTVVLRLRDRVAGSEALQQYDFVIR